MNTATLAFARGTLRQGEGERVTLGVETFAQTIDTTRRRIFAANPLQILGLADFDKPYDCSSGQGDELSANPLRRGCRSPWLGRVAAPRRCYPRSFGRKDASGPSVSPSANAAPARRRVRTRASWLGGSGMRGPAMKGPAWPRGDGSTDRRIDGSTDRRIDGSTDRRIDGSTDVVTSLITFKNRMFFSRHLRPCAAADDPVRRDQTGVLPDL
jgi:hypothetical protein